MNERRMHRRTFINARVRLYHTSFDSINATTRDISDGGVYVNLVERLELSPDMEIKMVLLDSPQPDIVFTMKVIRVEDGGLALMFEYYEKAGQRFEMDELRKSWQAR